MNSANTSSVSAACCKMGDSSRFEQHTPLGERKEVRFTRGQTIYYVHGSGAAVVLLPALGRSVSDFNQLVAELVAAGYQTISVESRGVGGSDGPRFPRPRLADFADDVLRVLRLEVGSQSPVNLIGRGLGNRVARILVGRMPSKIQSLVLVGAGGFAPPPKRLGLIYFFSQLPGVPARLRVKVVNAVIGSPDYPLPDWLTVRQPLSAFGRQSRAARKETVRDYDGDIRFPVLCVHGSCDRMVPSRNIARLHEIYQNDLSICEVPGAGHAAIHQQPDFVVPVIREFIGGANAGIQPIE